MVVISALVAGLVITAGVALGASLGTPDPSFGSGGSVVGPADAQWFASAVQSNGDVVVAGEQVSNGTPDVLVERLTPTGALDTAFGQGGTVTGPSVPGAGGSIARSVAIQPNGAIVIVGRGTSGDGSGSDGILVERYSAGGSLDASFGSGGVENLESGNFGVGNTVAIQSNGDILAGGSIDLTAVPYAAVARLTPSGTPDSSFGSSGIDVLQLGQYATVQSLALQSNGDIVAGGSTSPNGEATDGLVARLTSNGQLDTSFNGTGASITQFAQGTGAYSSVNGVTVGSDGTIFAAGSATTSNPTAVTFVASYNSAGALNSGFGSSGVASTPSANNWVEVQGGGVPGAAGILIAPNGDLIASGVYDDSTSTTYGTLWSFTPTGTLDSGFASSGVAEVAPTNNNNSAFAGAAVSPVSGDVIAAGEQGLVGGTSSALVTAFGRSTTSPTTTGTTTTPTPTKPTALKLTVTGVDANYSARTLARSGLKLTAACNRACKLKLTLTATSATARRLLIKTTVRTCKKVKGKEHCTTSKQYRALTLSASATLKGSGRHVFQLKLNKAIATALEKHPGTNWTLGVSAQATVKGVTSRSYRKSVRFNK
jgi:uncharacterized delta-60 repeat protein